VRPRAAPGNRSSPDPGAFWGVFPADRQGVRPLRSLGFSLPGEDLPTARLAGSGFAFHHSESRPSNNLSALPSAAPTMLFVALTSGVMGPLRRNQLWKDVVGAVLSLMTLGQIS
jgi:hypothetical protein